MILLDYNDILNPPRGTIVVFRWKADGQPYYKDSEGIYKFISLGDGLYKIENLFESLEININNIANRTGQNVVVKQYSPQEIIFKIEDLKKPDKIIYAGGRSTTTQVSGGTDENTLSRINAIELELELDALNRYKEFIYTGDDLTQTNIWNSPAKETKYFQMDYTYTGDNLTNIQVTRISDNYIYNKDFTYDGLGTLQSINIH